MTKHTIRNLLETDDFVRIRALIHSSLTRTRGGFKTPYVAKPEHLRSSYFGEDRLGWKECAGFVATDNERIVAFAGVYVAESSKNGLLAVGFDSEGEASLPSLLARCEEVVRAHGGRQLGRFTSLAPGQIRNDEITFWERYGFRADPYFHALLKLDVEEWRPPEQLDMTGIQPTGWKEFHAVVPLLRDSGETYLADEFLETFGRPTPDHVFLTMKNAAGELIGIAYYQVERFQDTSGSKAYDGLGSWHTGIHFRPEAGLSRAEKRRFIQSVLVSMKQLGVVFASGRLSSRDYDCLLALFAEGFDFQGSVPSVQNRMCKQIEPL